MLSRKEAVNLTSPFVFSGCTSAVRGYSHCFFLRHFYVSPFIVSQLELHYNSVPQVGAILLAIICAIALYVFYLCDLF